MKDLVNAISAEYKYICDRLKGLNVSLIDQLTPYGYQNLSEYFNEKREYLFKEWHPEAYYIDVRTLTTELENAVRNEKYGIYISTADYLYAFHGTDLIDYSLCDELDISVAELFYEGGTIVGGPKDLGIEIIAPSYLTLDSEYIINKIYYIISKYVDNAVIDGNDILVDGKKIMGSMCRYVGNTFVWAAQFSFEDHSDVISKICNKTSEKKPGYIDEAYLTKVKLKDEVLAWLQKH